MKSVGFALGLVAGWAALGPQLQHADARARKSLRGSCDGGKCHKKKSEKTKWDASADFLSYIDTWLVREVAVDYLSQWIPAPSFYLESTWFIFASLHGTLSRIFTSLCPGFLFRSSSHFEFHTLSPPHLTFLPCWSPKYGCVPTMDLEL